MSSLRAFVEFGVMGKLDTNDAVKYPYEQYVSI
jgi:hypothetical protein